MKVKPLRTLAEYDADIARMTAEREAVRATIQDPAQRDARRRWRVLWLGRLLARGVKRETLDMAQQLATASGPGSEPALRVGPSRGRRLALRRGCLDRAPVDGEDTWLLVHN